jgi:hypothetical protein
MPGVNFTNTFGANAEQPLEQIIFDAFYGSCIWQVQMLLKQNVIFLCHLHHAGSFAH